MTGLYIRTIGDYEKSEFTLNNSNIEVLTVQQGSTNFDWDNDNGTKRIIASESLKFNIKCKENCTIHLNDEGGTYILNNNLVNKVYSYTHDLVKGKSVNKIYIYRESSGGTVDMQKIDTILLDHPKDSKKVKIICPSVKRIENIYYRDGVYVDLTQMGYEDLKYVDTFSYENNTVWDLDRLIGKHFDNFGANVKTYIYKNKSNYEDEDNDNIISYIGNKIYTKHLKDEYLGPLDLVITEDTSYWRSGEKHLWSYTSYNYKYINHIYLTREAYDYYFTENPNGQVYGQFITRSGYNTTYEDDLDNPYIRCIDDL